VHTLTWDNGSAFTEHALINIALDARVTSPIRIHCGNAGPTNTNGLLRQYLPKCCDLGDFTDAQIHYVEDKLNRRPRKRLEFRSLQSVFDQSFKRAHFKVELANGYYNAKLPI
jgi:IS30 family transposase